MLRWIVFSRAFGRSCVYRSNIGVIRAYDIYGHGHGANKCAGGKQLLQRQFIGAHGTYEGGTVFGWGLKLCHGYGRALRFYRSTQIDRPTV